MYLAQNIHCFASYRVIILQKETFKVHGIEGFWFLISIHG